MNSLDISCRNKCGCVAWVRGLCKKCHARLQARVSRRTTTWEELEKEGLCDRKKTNSWGR